jgi:hypothetical protein
MQVFLPAFLNQETGMDQEAILAYLLDGTRLLLEVENEMKQGRNCVVEMFTIPCRSILCTIPYAECPMNSS